MDRVVPSSHRQWLTHRCTSRGDHEQPAVPAAAARIRLPAAARPAALRPAAVRTAPVPAAPAAEEAQHREDKEAAADEKKEDPKPAPAPVKVTAKKTGFSKSILAPDRNYTSVLVTVTNNSDDKVDVNPLYFTVTDTGGTKHTAELGVDEKQIDTVDLAPGENITGTITGKGTFTPKYVTYTDGLLGDSLRADVK